MAKKSRFSVKIGDPVWITKFKHDDIVCSGWGLVVDKNTAFIEVISYQVKHRKASPVEHFLFNKKGECLDKPCPTNERYVCTNPSECGFL